jgi:serine protease
MTKSNLIKAFFAKSSLLLLTSLTPLAIVLPTFAQTQPAQSQELFYTFKGQKIPLQQRQDAIAVAFKQVTTRGNSSPLALQLEEDLQKNQVRGGGGKPQVSPLGTNYALVKIPQGANSAAIQANIQKQPYVQNTLPVLTRTNTQETIVLPQEIIVRFEAGISESDRQAILQKNNLKLIRALRYVKNFYIVQSNSATGTQVLNVSNQLNQIKGISSATPNFIQSIPTSPIRLDGKFGNLKSQTKQSKEISPALDYLGLQWHIDSTPLQQCLQQKATIDALPNCLKSRTTSSASQKSDITRTDMHVSEAWKRSPNKGKDVVVAVVDSLIQWNHPDLQNNIYTVTAADKCPGERHGWDFSEPPRPNNTNACNIGDNDTRANPLELTILKRKFQSTFQLSDDELLARYSISAEALKAYFPSIPKAEAVEKVREYLRMTIGGEYHGTWVSGVIAAKPSSPQGLTGVAPNAKILPVRVFGLNGSIFTESYLEALAYSAARGADIINLSLGAMMPNDAEQQVFNQILSEHPNLVIVASSGNSNYPQVAYPSNYDGVLSVGATNLLGNRAGYSNYGQGLDVVAPGGDTVSPGWFGGIPTTGGTWMEAYWQGLAPATKRWAPVVDTRGKYWWVQGTSFSAPAVSGVVALIKGEDTKKTLNREGIIKLLESTASYNALTLNKEETELYQTLIKEGVIKPSVNQQQAFFGKGMINAEAALNAIPK